MSTLSSLTRVLELEYPLHLLGRDLDFLVQIQILLGSNAGTGHQMGN